MEKTYSISEVAKRFNITTNKIRFYEKKGLLNSLRTQENEYRTFNAQDILRLHSILLYRNMGISIGDIKNILENCAKDNCLAHFNNQWELINNEIVRLTTIRNSLEHTIDQLYEETSEYLVDEKIFNIMEANYDLYQLKNNWKDKWDFDHWANSYDEYVFSNKGPLKIYQNYEFVIDSVFQSASSLPIDSPRILEIGVGTGNLASKFLTEDCTIIGIDQSREMLTKAKSKFPNLKVLLGEFLKLPFSDKSFDVIVSTYAFHHLTADEKMVAIDEMLRVLKPEGHIIIGDLMFKNMDEEEAYLKTLTHQQVEIIKDEYYSYVDTLTTEFSKFNKRLIYQKIDELTYIIHVF
ncbi:MAG: MerR family transcriptional regulator [Turicibacter sp.]